MKVLVSGATGFVGKHLVSFLIEQGMTIRTLSRTQRKEFDDKIEQWVGDLTDSQSLQGIATDIDCVFHLGGYAHAWKENSLSEAQQHQSINLEGTKALLKECQKAGVKKFIFFSSIKAVGETEECVNEEWMELPLTPYGQAKRAAEEYVLEVGQKTRMHVCVLRLALVYGSGLKGNLYQMLKAIDKGYFLPIPPVKNKRSLVSVYDVCQAAWLVANNPIANGKIYFITDKSSYSTYDIYTAMRIALGRSSFGWSIPFWIFKLLAYIGDIYQMIFKKRFLLNSQALHKLFGSTHCSSERIQRELGFCPHYPLKQVLPDIVKQYREERA